MSHRAARRAIPASGTSRPRWIVLGAVACVFVLGSGMSASATGTSPAPSPTPTPSCQEWQTVTLLPIGPTPSTAPSTPGASTAGASTAGASTAGASTAGASTATASALPSRAVCRNAPPTPFEAPAWDPATVVGGTQLAGSGVIIDPAVTAPPEVLDVSYVVADLDSGAILAAKSPHAWLRPASTLKALTALTLIPRLDPKQVVVATDEHVAANGTRAGMLAGNPYPVGSLLDALLMLSANDAAYGLADAAGGYDRALALMNAKAREIGAHDTVAVDPSGLDEDGQRSSAYDLALIGRNAMKLKAFRQYIVKTDAIFPGGKDKTGKVYPPFHLMNINALLGHYPGAIGIKPGRTNRAQHTFIGAATHGGRTLIVTQMGSTTGSWEPTAALLDWGFANLDRARPVGHLVQPGEATAPTVVATTPSDDRPTTGTPAPTGPAGAARTAARTAALLDGSEALSASVEPTAELTAQPTLTAGLAVTGATGTLVALSVFALQRRRRRRP